MAVTIENAKTPLFALASLQLVSFTSPAYAILESAAANCGTGIGKRDFATSADCVNSNLALD